MIIKKFRFKKMKKEEIKILDYLELIILTQLMNTNNADKT